MCTMISEIASNTQLHKLVVSTGNILNVNNQLGRKSSEELLDGLQLALQSDSTASKYVKLNEHEAQVLCAAQELNEKLTENERAELSIGAKIFINNNKSPECIAQAVQALLQVLQVQHVDNVVLAFHPQAQTTANDIGTPTTPNVSTTANFQWSGKSSEQSLTELKQLWSQLEKHALAKEIYQLGVCDLDAETLTALHATAQVPPTIAQINLASCCVVPTTLQEFCTQHDIQLLTHSDPEVLLSAQSALIPGYCLDWTLRYQVHVRCRGVIKAKGYIVGASRITESA